MRSRNHVVTAHGAGTATIHPGAGWLPASRRSREQNAGRLSRVKAGLPLGTLLLLTGILSLWGLSRNGYGNSYYAAAVEAGTHSWKAFLFGSLDAANYITVDKPPASLWLMEISTRLFGFSSFSILLPEALTGIGSVALLYTTVRRWFGQPAALLSGALLAITPVAALMFRFNNPDALLVLLMVLAAYCVTRALERGGTRWLVCAGIAIGFAFLTKMLQAFLVLPAFTLVYLIAAPVSVRRRLWQLGAAGVAMVAAAGWWVALVELWPASARPYIGGSTNNSILDLVFGWNGLERLSGGGVGGGGGSFSGSAGILRLFNAQMGGEISWLLPAALLAIVAGVISTARRPRTDRLRAATLLWGGWLIVTAAVFSAMTGVIHPYYTNMLAPAIAVLVGVGATTLYQQRSRLVARLTMTAMIAATSTWSYVLLERTPHWHPWLRVAILAGGLGTAVVLAVAGTRLRQAALAGTATVAILASAGGMLAYTLSTVSKAQTGSTPSSGPASSQTGSGGPGSSAAGGSFEKGSPRRAPGSSSSAPASGGMGGSQTVSSSLRALLKRSSSKYTWVAATSSAISSSSLQLASDKPVMAIGGFTGTDNSTTLKGFEKLVSEGKIHYYIASGVGGGGAAGGFGSAGRGVRVSDVTVPSVGTFKVPSGARGGIPGGAGGAQGSRGGIGDTGVATQIETWVTKHFKKHTVGGTTVYDLTQRPGVK